MPHAMLAHYRRLALLATRSTAIYAVLAGLATILGGDRRMEGPAYTSLRELASTASVSPSWSVGVFLVAAGVLAAIPRYRASQGGLFLVLAGHLYIGLSFTLSVYAVPRAGVLIIPLALFVATMTGGLIAVRHADKGAREHA